MQISSSKIAAALVLAGMLAVSGCASKKKVPNNAADLGLNSAKPGSPQDFTVNVGDRVFFETDSSSLTATARTTLDRQAAWLLRYTSYPITVEGHADERGTREYNLALGARRATSTRNYLTAKGITRGRIKTISFGKERPVAVCNDISCWSQNRRAVTLLRGPSS